MTEPVRRNLLAGLERKPAATPGIADAAIAEAASRHGFRSTEPDPSYPVAPIVHAAPEAAAVPAPAAPRRVRKLLKRDQQLNVRLRVDTMEEIYAICNERDIPIAQLIEEALAALQAQTARD